MSETEKLPEAVMAEPPGPEQSETAEGPPPAAGGAPLPARRGGAALATLAAIGALALALFATTIAGFLWWQYREFYVALDAADEETGRALDSVRAGVASVEERMGALRASVDANRDRAAAVVERLEPLPARLAALEMRLSAAQGGSFEARSDWLRAQAEYYLALASAELELAGRWDNAIAALEHADRTLAQLSDPALASVREEIAGELIALRGVSLPDIEGLAFSLARLEERAPSLPLRAGVPEQGPNQPATSDEAQPGLGRLWSSAKQALGGIVRVQRTEQPVGHIVTAEQRRLLRTQLAVELMLARLAALGGEGEAFEASLAAAAALLEREFDTSTAEVEGAAALLEQMRALEIAPPQPDISGSLRLLRALPAGDA